MDLMCNEKDMFKEHHQIDNHMQHMMHIEPQVNTASADPTFLSERCLENLLKSEETHPALNFYNNPQCEITPKMRRIVAEWMMEVSFHVYHLQTTCFHFQERKKKKQNANFVISIQISRLCNRFAILEHFFDFVFISLSLFNVRNKSHANKEEKEEEEKTQILFVKF